MDREPDHDGEGDPTESEHASRVIAVESIWPAVGVAAAMDTVCMIAGQLLRAGVRHPGVAASVIYVVLASKIGSGYVGGRVAGRRGVCHDDGSALWTVAWAVTALSMMAVLIFERYVPFAQGAHGVGPQWPGPAPGLRLMQFVLEALVMAAFVRLGLAVGSWVQAAREGRATDEPDEE
ncbi:MAG: hypothetical protein Q8Q09_08800 [Deltaproteobacteria bacterium]|nr:hypothetical protein [Deltaproteobacteria bacterium]